MNESPCNHTLIIRTRNRPAWLLASIQGYLKFGYEGVLFVVDDSEGEVLIRNQQTINNFKNTSLNIRHLHGFSKEIEKRHKRLVNSTRKALELVKTDFLTFTSDDDFFFPTFIEPAVEFLNNKPDHTGVVGPEIILWADNKLGVKEITTRWWPAYQSEDPLERFANYCFSQSLSNYGVFRSQFIRLMKQVEVKTCQPFTGGSAMMGSIFLDEEIQWNQMLVSSGKIGQLPSVPMNMRVWHQSESRLEISTRKFNSLPTPQNHGAFVEMMDDRFPETLRHWVNEACTWMMLCETKYSKEKVYSTILRWNQKMLFQYQGGGPQNSQDDFSIKLKQQMMYKNSIKSFYQKFPLKWLKIILKLLKGDLHNAFLEIKDAWPFKKICQNKIFKSKEVSEFMDHFHSLEKEPLLQE
jgi:glycosyltransferase domain-containing protein